MSDTQDPTLLIPPRHVLFAFESPIHGIFDFAYHRPALVFGPVPFRTAHEHTERHRASKLTPS